MFYLEVECNLEQVSMPNGLPDAHLTFIHSFIFKSVLRAGINVALDGWVGFDPAAICIKTHSTNSSQIIMYRTFVMHQLHLPFYVVVFI